LNAGGVAWNVTAIVGGDPLLDRQAGDGANIAIGVK
jgi:hypothetical protein